MSFQLQYRALASELRKAGLDGDAAVRIAQILGNSAQPTRTGPVQVDTTAPGLRRVTADKRRHQFTALDFREGDQDFRRSRVRSGEDRPRPSPASSVQSSRSPQESTTPFNVKAGSYTEARSSSDGVEVGLRVSGTGPLLTQDAASGMLVGKSIRAEADVGANGFLRFFVEEQAGEYVLKLQIDRDLLRDLIYELLGISPPSQDESGRFPLQTTAALALVNATLDARGLCFTRANGAVLCFPTVSCS